MFNGSLSPAIIDSNKDSDIITTQSKTFLKKPTNKTVKNKSVLYLNIIMRKYDISYISIMPH